MITKEQLIDFGFTQKEDTFVLLHNDVYFLIKSDFSIGIVVFGTFMPLQYQDSEEKVIINNLNQLKNIIHLCD